MEITSLLYAFLSLTIFIVVIFSFLSHARWSQRGLNLPPSPPGLPIIGHLHLLKHPVHRTLHGISQKLGSAVFSLQLGNRFVVVVSSPSAVDECFTKNDIVLANRPQLLNGKHMGYDNTMVSLANYNDHWRNLRRILTVELLSTNRLNGFASIWREEVEILLRHLPRSSCCGFTKVELTSKFMCMTFNIVMRMVAGKRYYGEQSQSSDVATNFQKTVKEMFKYFGSTNPADFLQILKWIDYNSYQKNMKKVNKTMDAFLQGLVDEHRKDKSTKAMIGRILLMQKSEPENYSDTIIKGLIEAMILAGVETSSVTMTWAMSNLLNHPELLKKAQAELDTQVGQDRLFDETDLSKLKYLKAIIYETMRLFPAAPLLVPHTASGHCKIAGYDVPRNTLVLINAWAVHRDPSVWDDPETFKPERFLGGEVEGHKFLPFGLGRRACPGSGQALRVMGVTLGSLIQCFEWERVSKDAIDLTEGEGLTIPKKEPLEALCKPRDHEKGWLSH